MQRARHVGSVLLVSLIFGFIAPAYSASDKPEVDCIDRELGRALLVDRKLGQWRKNYLNAPKETVELRKKLQKEGFQSAALNEEIVNQHNTQYSHVIPDAKIWDQMQTGDCWDFAACRVFVDDLIKRGIVAKGFKPSPGFIFFHSMLEKSDIWLRNNVSDLRKAGLSENELTSIFNVNGAVNDGGYFEYFNFLVSKYGLVPESAMKSTASLRRSSDMDQELSYKLAAISKAMKDKYLSFRTEKGQEQLSKDQIAELLDIRERGMEDVFHILASHLGLPPEKFTFKFKDGVTKEFTPKQFAKEVLKYTPKKYAVISSDPTLPYDQTFILPDSRIAVQRKSDPDSANHFLNVRPERLMELVINSVLKDRAVWFGADVTQAVVPLSHSNSRAAGIMHPDIFKADGIYNVPDKAAFPKLDDSLQERIFGTTAMDHAMTFYAADLKALGKRKDLKNGVYFDYDKDSGKFLSATYVKAGKVFDVVKLGDANSWSEKVGTKGRFHMYPEWFIKYVSQIAVRRELLSPSERKLLKVPATPLPGN